MIFHSLRFSKLKEIDPKVDMVKATKLIGQEW